MCCKGCIFEFKVCPIMKERPKDACMSKVTKPSEYIKRLNDMVHYVDKKGSLAKVQKLKKIKEEFKHQLAQGWYDAYVEDKRRGEPGSKSEADANAKTSRKQKMKDNRPVECIPNSVQRQKVYDATKQWEEENGKLPRLSMNSMSNSKIDSYTGEEIE